ncbi:MAG: hypothetical protein ACI82A_002811 [Candidatus Azotimanducaceae bacterium]
MSGIGGIAQVLVTDIKNNRVSYDTWFEGRGGNTQNLTLSDGEKARDTTVIGDGENYLNRLQHKITMPFPSSPNLKLYIDAQTHLISKMVRAYLSIPFWALLPLAVIPDCRQDLIVSTAKVRITNLWLPS